MDHHALSSWLRRSSPASRRRALLLFHCLRRFSFGVHQEEGSTSHTLEPQDVVNVVLFAFGDVPPRFLFVVGPKGAMLRSADRGRTWRKLQSWKTVKRVEEPEVDEDVGALDQLQGILNLLPATDAEKDKEPVVEVPDLHCVTCWKDSVAVCGANGFIGISCDRGGAFTVASSETISGMGLRDRTKSANEFMTFRGLCFVSDTQLFAYGSSTLVDFTVARRSLSVVEFVSARVLHKFTDPIGMLQSFFLAGDAHASHVFLSVKGSLFVLWHGVKFFVELKHTLGLIRSLCCINQFDTPEFPAAPPVDESEKSRKFSYYGHSVMGSESFVNTAVEGSADGNAADELQQILARDGSGCFAILGVDGQVVEYDFTGLLFFRIERDEGGSIHCHTNAANVDHIAFVKSGHQERVGLAALASHRPRCAVLLRSTVSGLSISNDLGATWTAPSQAFMGTAVALDRGTVAACNTRNFVALSENFGKQFKSMPIPATLRVVSLNYLAVMQ